MSGRIELNRITNANVYANGNCLLGRVDEAKLPDISVKFTEHKALGMVGTIELPTGFDKMEGELKWNSFYEEASTITSDPFTMVQLQCRSSVDTYNAQGRKVQKALVTLMTVAFKKNALGSFKQNDTAEFATPFACYYIKQQIDGKDVVELDVLSNIYKVNGKDMLDMYRKNIGG